MTLKVKLSLPHIQRLQRLQLSLNFAYFTKETLMNSILVFKMTFKKLCFTYPHN